MTQQTCSVVGDVVIVKIGTLWRFAQVNVAEIVPGVQQGQFSVLLKVQKGLRGRV